MEEAKDVSAHPGGAHEAEHGAHGVWLQLQGEEQGRGKEGVGPRNQDTTHRNTTVTAKSTGPWRLASAAGGGAGEGGGGKEESKGSDLRKESKNRSQRT